MRAGNVARAAPLARGMSIIPHAGGPWVPPDGGGHNDKNTCTVSRSSHHGTVRDPAAAQRGLHTPQQRHAQRSGRAQTNLGHGDRPRRLMEEILPVPKTPIIHASRRQTSDPGHPLPFQAMLSRKPRVCLDGENFASQHCRGGGGAPRGKAHRNGSSCRVCAGWHFYWQNFLHPQ